MVPYFLNNFIRPTLGLYKYYINNYLYNTVISYVAKAAVKT